MMIRKPAALLLTVAVAGAVLSTGPAAIADGPPRVSVRILTAEGAEIGGHVRFQTLRGQTVYDAWYQETANIPEGQYRLMVSPDGEGYVQHWWYGDTSDAAKATVVELTDDRDFTFTVHAVPAGSVSGTVTGSTGSPIGGIDVQAFLVSPVDGSTQLVTSPVQTDSLGSYTFDGLEAGEYLVRALQASQYSAPALGPTYFPATRTFEDASPVAVTAGEVTPSIDLTLLPSAPPQVDRLSGADRFEVSALASATGFPDGASRVYIASGGNWPDALSAGPAAAYDGAPLLLTAPGHLPTAVASEIARLEPEQVVIVGGPASVSDSVRAELQAIAPTTRISGADRYAVSRTLMSQTFGSPVSSQYALLATGRNFPDALSAGAVAADMESPLLLIDGQAPTLDPATRETLFAATVYNPVTVGGPASVRPELVHELGYFHKWCEPGSTTCEGQRISGADRFAANRAVNAFKTGDALYPSQSDGTGTGSDTAYLVSGLDFPDALSATTVASSTGARVYLSRTDCIPSETLSEIARQQITHLVLVGGPVTLTPAVASLRPC